jgi:hypothetical protein
VSDFDTFLLKHAEETEFTTEKLVWIATVAPTEVAISEGSSEIGDVAFTITGVMCASLTS